MWDTHLDCSDCQPKMSCVQQEWYPMNNMIWARVYGTFTRPTALVPCLQYVDLSVLLLLADGHACVV